MVLQNTSLAFGTQTLSSAYQWQCTNPDAQLRSEDTLGVGVGAGGIHRLKVDVEGRYTNTLTTALTHAAGFSQRRKIYHS
ncbi:hypothetical protein I79_016961 [Cricetulus griseus]|uniref:Uncharacterized protein n=1 Tax=Cricetulus griseus TaxID=10029 RepID=G3I0S2_CRIGR|nr:hypothetical protein I79_016961 [Cricetulus griseus]